VGAHTAAEGRAVPGPSSGRGESRSSDCTHQKPSWGGEVAGARGRGLEGSRRCSRMAWAVAPRSAARHPTGPDALRLDPPAGGAYTLRRATLAHLYACTDPILPPADALPADALRWLHRQPAELRGRQLHLCQRFVLRRLPEQLWWLRELLPVLQQREHLQRLVRTVLRRHLHQQFELRRHRGRERHHFLWKQFHLSRHLHRGVLGELRRWVDLRPNVSIGYQPTLDSDGRPVHLSGRPRKTS
jgi:hypothetical protein